MFHRVQRIETAAEAWEVAPISDKADPEQLAAVQEAASDLCEALGGEGPFEVTIQGSTGEPPLGNDSLGVHVARRQRAKDQGFLAPVKAS